VERCVQTYHDKPQVVASDDPFRPPRRAKGLRDAYMINNAERQPPPMIQGRIG
jgi:hypothetical protein